MTTFSAEPPHAQCAPRRIGSGIATHVGRQLPVRIWAAIGALILTSEIMVWLRWISGSQFQPTDPGSDPLTPFAQWVVWISQPLALLLGAVFLWLFIIRPWRRSREMTTSVMLAISWTIACFWDPFLNYTATQILYNSHLINFGTWGLGSAPGWMSPNGNLLPHPLIILIPGYLIAGWGPILGVFHAIRWAVRRWPGLGITTQILIGIVALTISDTLVEVTFCRTSIYAYPAAIRAVTLFAGETYQFPLTEALFFGGLGQGATLILLLLTNDKGHTLAERGLESVRIGGARRQGLRFLALFGFSHLGIVLGFVIPVQWLALHGDTFPDGYPSYMLNGMCVYGPDANQCPGPGVMIPRLDFPSGSARAGN